MAASIASRAEAAREARRRSMLPGGSRDAAVAVAKIALPLASLALLAVLIALPLSATQEFSFLLSKDSAMKADERMRVTEATYRGETGAGEPFEIRAESGVQKSSAVPVVVLTDLTAQIRRADGLSTVTAPQGEFLIERNQVLIQGPVEARAASGYSLDGSRILVDIDSNRITSTDPVSGTLPMGTFSAGSFEADIEGRRVILEERVSMRITPSRKAS